MSRPKPKSLGQVKHFAKVSRQVVLRRMAADQCFSSRLYWAAVLLAWCGPESTDDGLIVKKDEKGYIKRDKQGQPIPGRQKDLMDALNLKSGLKGKVSRTVARLIEGGQFWTDETGSLYVDPEPPAFEDLEKVASTGNQKWVIADQIVRIEDLASDDPVASTASIRCLEELSTAWKNEHKVVRTRFRELLVQAISEGRIIIDKKRRKEENNNNNNASDPDPAPEQNVVVAPVRFLEVQNEDENPEKAGSPPPAPPDGDSDAVDVSRVMEVLNERGATTEKAVRQFVDKCRRLRPACTTAEIIETIYRLARGINPGTTNPVGMLLTQVPLALQALKPPKARERPFKKPTCTQCGGYGFLDGFHWQLLPEARAHFRGGGTLCSCEEGEQLQELIGEFQGAVTGGG